MTTPAKELSTFLRSIEGLYPRGIPCALFKKQYVAQPDFSSYVLFVQVDDPGPDIEAEQKLFEAIVEKGLSLRLKAAALKRFGSNGSRADQLAELRKAISEKAPSCIVGLGYEAAELLLDSRKNFADVRSTWLEFNGLPLIISYRLSEIALDPSIKRRFWDHLKLVKAKITASP